MNKPSDAYISVSIESHRWSIAARSTSKNNRNSYFVSHTNNTYPLYNKEYPFFYPLFKTITTLDIFSYAYTYYLGIILNSTVCNIDTMQSQADGDTTQKTRLCFATHAEKKLLCLYHTYLVQLTTLARAHNIFLLFVGDATDIQNIHRKNTQNWLPHDIDAYSSLIHKNTHALMEDILWK